MGMYTILVLNVALDEKQTAIVDVVQRMVDGDGPGEGRLKWMLKSSSYYHDNIQHASVEHDDISHTFKLSVYCDIKNYENEIEQFLQLIAPAVVTNDLAGYVRYEEAVQPTLVWFSGGKVLNTPPEDS